MKKPRNSTQLSDRQQQLAELLEQARRKPGVAEAEAVYDVWRAVEEKRRAYDKVLALSRVVSLSDSSGPSIRPI